MGTTCETGDHPVSGTPLSQTAGSTVNNGGLHLEVLVMMIACLGRPLDDRASRLHDLELEGSWKLVRVTHCMDPSHGTVGHCFGLRECLGERGGSEPPVREFHPHGN